MSSAGLGRFTEKGKDNNGKRESRRGIKVAQSTHGKKEKKLEKDTGRKQSEGAREGEDYLSRFASLVFDRTVLTSRRHFCANVARSIVEGSNYKI